jgi:hypothetical protein
MYNQGISDPADCPITRINLYLDRCILRCKVCVRMASFRFANVRGLVVTASILWGPPFVCLRNLECELLQFRTILRLQLKPPTHEFVPLQEYIAAHNFSQ